MVNVFGLINGSHLETYTPVGEAREIDKVQREDQNNEWYEPAAGLKGNHDYEEKALYVSQASVPYAEISIVFFLPEMITKTSSC